MIAAKGQNEGGAQARLAPSGAALSGRRRDGKARVCDDGGQP
jgi:hypothetical protein